MGGQVPSPPVTVHVVPKMNDSNSTGLALDRPRGIALDPLHGNFRLLKHVNPVSVNKTACRLHVLDGLGSQSTCWASWHEWWQCHRLARSTGFLDKFHHVGSGASSHLHNWRLDGKKFKQIVFLDFFILSLSRTKSFPWTTRAKIQRSSPKFLTWSTPSKWTFTGSAWKKRNSFGATGPMD